jgi:hypothetical protein
MNIGQRDITCEEMGFGHSLCPAPREYSAREGGRALDLVALFSFDPRAS